MLPHALAMLVTGLAGKGCLVFARPSAQRVSLGGCVTLSEASMPHRMSESLLLAFVQASACSGSPCPCPRRLAGSCSSFSLSLSATSSGKPALTSLYTHRYSLYPGGLLSKTFTSFLRDLFNVSLLGYKVVNSVR